MSNIVSEHTTFTGGVRIVTTPEGKSQKFKATDTTPSVKNSEVWIANNTGATTVTQFDDGQDTQKIHILGDGFTTVANNANIKTSTGANKLLAVNLVYNFIKIGTVWYEF